MTVCICHKDELNERCHKHGMLGNPRLMDFGSLVNEVISLREALLRVLRESHDGEAMAIAAEALGLDVDRTEAP